MENPLNAGSVAGVKHIRNPINAAIEVMRNSPHVMMTGIGAEAFARLQGLRMEDSSYFYTEKRHNQLLRALEKEKQQGMLSMDYQYKFGTVGQWPWIRKAIFLQEHPQVA
jgi:beta-aspartyl-peptidase (threonine type)